MVPVGPVLKTAPVAFYSGIHQLLHQQTNFCFPKAPVYIRLSPYFYAPPLDYVLYDLPHSPIACHYRSEPTEAGEARGGITVFHVSETVKKSGAPVGTRYDPFRFLTKKRTVYM